MSAAFPYTLCAFLPPAATVTNAQRGLELHFGETVVSKKEDDGTFHFYTDVQVPRYDMVQTMELAENLINDELVFSFMRGSLRFDFELHIPIDENGIGVWNVRLDGDWTLVDNPGREGLSKLYLEFKRMVSETGRNR